MKFIASIVPTIEVSLCHPAPLVLRRLTLQDRSTVQQPFRAFSASNRLPKPPLCAPPSPLRIFSLASFSCISHLYNYPVNFDSLYHNGFSVSRLVTMTAMLPGSELFACRHCDLDVYGIPRPLGKKPAAAVSGMERGIFCSLKRDQEPIHKLYTALLSRRPLVAYPGSQATDF